MTLFRILAALIAFVICGVALTPLNFVLSLVAPNQSGLSYSDASGSIWNGTLSGVSFRNVPIGDVTVQVSPLALLTGRLSASVGSSGSFRSAVISRTGNTTTVTKLNGQWLASTYYSDLPDETMVAVSNGGVNLSSNGCLDASGRIDVMGLESLNLSPLSGTVRCEAGEIVAPLAFIGETSAPVVDLVVSFAGADGPHLKLVTSDPLVATALQSSHVPVVMK